MHSRAGGLALLAGLALQADAFPLHREFYKLHKGPAKEGFVTKFGKLLAGPAPNIPAPRKPAFDVFRNVPDDAGIADHPPALEAPAPASQTTLFAAGTAFEGFDTQCPHVSRAALKLGDVATLAECKSLCGASGKSTCAFSHDGCYGGCKLARVAANWINPYTGANSCTYSHEELPCWTFGFTNPALAGPELQAVNSELPPSTSRYEVDGATSAPEPNPPLCGDAEAFCTIRTGHFALESADGVPIRPMSSLNGRLTYNDRWHDVGSALPYFKLNPNGHCSVEYDTGSERFSWSTSCQLVGAQDFFRGSYPCRSHQGPRGYTCYMPRALGSGSDQCDLSLAFCQQPRAVGTSQTLVIASESTGCTANGYPVKCTPPDGGRCLGPPQYDCRTGDHGSFGDELFAE